MYNPRTAKKPNKFPNFNTLIIQANAYQVFTGSAKVIADEPQISEQSKKNFLVQGQGLSTLSTDDSSVGSYTHNRAAFPPRPYGSAPGRTRPPGGCISDNDAPTSVEVSGPKSRPTQCASIHCGYKI